MKIGIYDPYLDTLGGGEKYMLTAASCLSDKNEVYIFWDQGNDVKKGADRFNLDLSKVKSYKNIFNLSFQKKLQESKKFDAIFLLSDGSIPLLLTKTFVHFQFPVEWVRANSLISLKTRFIKKIICNSEFTKKYIDEKFGVKSVVVYPPTYLKKDLPFVSFQKKKNIILNVGRLQADSEGNLFKKQDFLINVFKKIDPKFNWELVLVVSYQEKDKELVSRLKKLSEGFKVRILENISKENLDKIYEESKIYWHSSGFEEDLNKFPEKAEHFGITTVEAMLNGVVPVVIGAGGQLEIVENEKNGFLWNNESEIINKTLDLIKNNNKLEDFSQKARKSAEKFLSDEFCKKILSIFENA